MTPAPPLVMLDRVDVRLAGRTLVEDVSLTLRRGEGLALTGPNGSGKSTVLRLLRGDAWPHPASRGGRTFHVDGEASGSPIGARERIALVSPEAQDLYVRRDLELGVETVIRSGFDGAIYPEAPATPAQAARVREVADALGVAHLLGRSVLELSRGEGRRVLLARALAPRPLALLLDEAADGLDAAARGAFLEAVGAILAGGTAVAMATHREEEIGAGFHERIRLEGGRVVKRERPIAVPSFDSGRPPAGRPDGPRSARAGRPAAAPVAFRLDRVTVLVEGRPVLCDVDWTLRRGERWGVVGGNGAGKSTLLRLLAGEEQPATGTALRLDLGADADRFALAGRVGLVSPELQARHRNGGLAERIAASGFEGAIGLGEDPPPDRLAAARAAMARLGVSALEGRDAARLSYGEVRRLLLARALAPGPEVLLLDEPLAGLDAATRAAALAIFAEEAARGTTLVVVSHHGDELPPDLDHLARLDDGRFSVVR
ncbi:MAG: ATP-binding cassette domain-containing protein [Anaeromyxobacteraceae bacterium]